MHPALIVSIASLAISIGSLAYTLWVYGSARRAQRRMDARMDSLHRARVGYIEDRETSWTRF